MKADREFVRLSASDLSNHLECRHLTSLDLAVALGKKSPPKWKSPDLWVLQERGAEHEAAYLRHLERGGLTVLNLGDIEDDNRALSESRDAMARGVPVIAQATLAHGRWFGRADVLRRVQRASDLGAWSYEVYDCKLARETKAATILQLSLYSDLLQTVQGLLPEKMYVIPPSEEFMAEEFRVLDFAAYYRYVKKRLESVTDANPDGIQTYPEPTPHCPVCRWWRECDSQWRQDDHLSLVAGISKLQRKQLHAWDTNTVQRLAELPLPLQKVPEHGSKEGYVRVREQARVQVEGRSQGKPVHELLKPVEGHGFYRLPEPSAGDIFLDLEGDPFVGFSGMEYLFGYVTDEEPGKPTYARMWAITPEEEKQAFEWFVDFAVAQWARYPAMHMYHFGAYEPSALKRLMGRYATREDEIDRVLRAGLLVDIHTIFKQAARASVEKYSLKDLEVFHGFGRSVSLDDSRRAMRQVEHGLELGRLTELDELTRKIIETYNADDCLSARSLRNSLEAERRTLEEVGVKVPRPAASEGAAPEAVDERQQRVARLVGDLTKDLPTDPQRRTEEEKGRCLLASLLDWHRREDKADWWEYFRLRDLTDEELLHEKSAVALLSLVTRVGLQGKLPVDRYSFEKQDTDIRQGDTVYEKGERYGTVMEIDFANRTIDIKKTKKTAEVHPVSVFAFEHVDSTELAESLYRLGMWASSTGINAAGHYRAGRDLLLRLPPRLANGEAVVRPGESTLDAARRVVTSLDHSLLAIQGPPGSGKTFTGAEMICELVQRGKRVGVAAVSHKVIRRLLEEVLKAARRMGLSGITCLHKMTEKSVGAPPEGISETTKNEVALAALQGNACTVVGGTAWLWAREELFESLDVLFIDEAGQISLANALAVAQAAKSVVLLGDPQQLDQPRRGSHPEGAEASALEHLLAGSKTIAQGKGLFLEKTWRLHPRIGEFTSEVFYDGRLQSREGLENQRIEGHSLLSTAGLWFAPVRHEGNQNASPEEVEKVAGLVEGLLKPEVQWVDDEGNQRRFTIDDVLIVAPYNAQVSDLSARLRRMRIGTVDKFQGQEAPLVIYSLTTSSPEDAPRGMEFLYSLNRLNVATSRARAAVVIVGSQRLLEPECRTPRQMQLANALCRYVELAQVLVV
ncbi:MAG: TM0106 family RecB-like putative nuclease [Acidobacteria bacterium]|nr:TM0106 family RecB-like putative nuclease [Acidobacteriota bacterium]